MTIAEALALGEGWTWARNQREVIFVTDVHAAPASEELYCRGAVGHCPLHRFFATRNEAADGLLAMLNQSIKLRRIEATMMERAAKRLVYERE